jgi:hypothetical protein
VTAAPRYVLPKNFLIPHKCYYFLNLNLKVTGHERVKVRDLHWHSEQLMRYISHLCQNKRGKVHVILVYQFSSSPPSEARQMKFQIAMNMSVLDRKTSGGFILPNSSNETAFSTEAYAYTGRMSLDHLHCVY